MARYRGAGTVVSLGSTADPLTAVFTVIPQITSVSLDEQSGELEVTDLGSTRKEYIQDLPDSASIKLSINYDPAQATHNEVSGLVSLFNSGAYRVLRILPNGAIKSINYVGFVMGNSVNFEPTSVQKLEVPFRASGGATYI